MRGKVVGNGCLGLFVESVGTAKVQAFLHTEKPLFWVAEARKNLLQKFPVSKLARGS